MQFPEKVLKNTIDSLQLDLTGKTVLTEAATGPYAVTAIIAALAGAEVHAFAKDSKYGTVKQAFEEVEHLTKIVGATHIHFIDEITPEILKKADVITNSGHLRPLNEKKLQYIRQNAVISLMYEAWELRESDVDIHYCKKKGIKVAATNERHPQIALFDYLGEMALKLITKAGLDAESSKLILVCNNDFGPYIAKTLAEKCECLGIIDKEENCDNYHFSENMEWLSNFPQVEIPKQFKNTDVIVFTAYPFDKKWVGNGDCPISAYELQKKTGNAMLLRFAGDVDTKTLHELNFNHYPKSVSSGHMGVLPSDIGYEPVIKLQAGGLKVGELALRNKTEFENVNLATFV
ncbi:MAG: hypothetical protein COA57_13905 [Flavobacteriales bacterium]|nr:MAG: hypothetical protein COA57_13905 [Flavobacteriales bacterium]